MRKIKIKQINSGGVLFPPLESTLELLGLPSGVAALAREVKKRTGEPLPADNKTLNKITTEGIGRKKVLEIFDYIVSGNDLANNNCLSIFSFFDQDFRKKMVEAIGQSPWNGHSWDCFLTYIEKSCDLSLPKTLAFLKKRIQAEKKAHQGDTRDEMWLQRYIKIVSENMLVDRALVEDIYRCLAHNPEIPKSELMKNHKEFLNVVAVDFYFWLLVYIQQDLFDIIISEVTLNHEELAQAEEGPIQHILPQLKDHKLTGSLALLFDRWRTIISNKILQKEKPISIFEFAQYMPDPVLTDKIPAKKSKEYLKLRNENPKMAKEYLKIRKEELEKSKYRAFCDWRSGNIIPSDDKLERFIAELLPKCRERYWWFWFAKIAIAMDKFFKKLTVNGDLSEVEAVTLFQTYKNYYREARQRDAN